MDTIIKTYPNGLRLVVTPMANFKSVAFRVYIMAGSGEETKDEEGLSHFCEHMLFKGTTKRTGQQIIDEFARLGVAYNAWTSESATCYHTKGIADNLENCVDLLADMYFNTKFTDDDFDKEGDVIVQEIAMHDDRPTSVLYDKMNAVFYQGTKYEHPVAGYADAIKKYQPQDIYRYLKKHYIAPNTIIAFAGDISVARAEELVAQYFLPFMATTVAQPKQRQNIPAIQPPASRSQVKKDTKQQHVALAFPVCNQYSADRHALCLFSLLFGGDMSSRLFINVREKLGLVYSISAEMELSDIGGNLMVRFSCTPQNTQKVIDVVGKEIETLRREGVTEDELLKYRNQWRMQRLMDSEVTSFVNDRATSQVATHNRIIGMEEELKIVDALTVSDVNAVIKKYLLPDHMITVIVGK
ncbi:MAG: insulinase family protein [Prevotella sp.]|nr:insulinase family protein [Prevotella sp.]